MERPQYVRAVPPPSDDDQGWMLSWADTGQQAREVFLRYARIEAAELGGHLSGELPTERWTSNGWEFSWPVSYDKPVPPPVRGLMCRCVNCCCKSGEGHRDPAWRLYEAELRARERYLDAKASGLSEYEAREEGWPS